MLGKQRQRDSTKGTKDKRHKVLPNDGGTTRDNATNQCNKGQRYERGREAVVLGTTMGAKTKKKRDMMGSRDGGRDTGDYLTREAPQGTMQPPMYQRDKKRCLWGCKGIVYLLNINVMNQHQRRCSLPSHCAMQQDTRGNGNSMRWTNWANSNATTKKEEGAIQEAEAWGQ
jgi:hypothetical protein